MALSFIPLAVRCDWSTVTLPRYLARRLNARSIETESLQSTNASAYSRSLSPPLASAVIRWRNEGGLLHKEYSGTYDRNVNPMGGLIGCEEKFALGGGRLAEKVKKNRDRLDSRVDRGRWAWFA